MIKNIEAIRCGEFANKPDMNTNHIDDGVIIDFNYVNKKEREVKDVLMSCLQCLICLIFYKKKRQNFFYSALFVSVCSYPQADKILLIIFNPLEK
jgi:hypothetical protein